MYSRSFISILDEIVSLINLDMEIKSITSAGDLHTLKICDLKHAQKGYSVVIGGVSYKITDIDFPNKEMVVEGSPDPTDTYFELYPVYFFYGTPRETSTEISKNIQATSHSNSVTPMIFLNETFEEDANYEEESSIDREIAPFIYALGQRPEDKFSKDLQEDYVKPMRRLMEEFIKAAQKKTELIDMREYKTKLVNYSKFGVYVSNSGVNQNLFAMPLSGCSNNGTIKLYAKEECCEDECETDDQFLSEDDEDLISQNNDILIQEP